MKKPAFKNIAWLCGSILALLGMSCTQKEDIRLFVAGDSTAQSYRVEQTLMRGWAQYLELFFDERVQVENRSMAGRSSKSFREEGRWNKILEDLRKGDVVFIQFGHNDTSTKPERHASPADYRQNLRRFVQEVREREATPVLLTSIVLCTFNDSGQLVDRRLKEYPQIVRDLAAEEKVILIDMFRLSFDLLQELGPEEARKLYMFLEPGEDPSRPQGSNDDTHLRERGAKQLAALVAEEIRQARIKPLYRYLLDKEEWPQ